VFAVQYDFDLLRKKFYGLFFCNSKGTPGIRNEKKLEGDIKTVIGENGVIEIGKIN
jgi:hypothetical protein